MAIVDCNLNLPLEGNDKNDFSQRLYIKTNFR